MTEINHTEEEIRHRDHVMRLIYGYESKFYYSFAYGSAFIFLYLVKAHLEPGNLMGVTNLLSVLSVYFWLSTNPWWCLSNVSRHLMSSESEELIEKFDKYKTKASQFGFASYVLMLLASWYFIWK